ncbi:hypothetical protein K0A97_00620 [Patescibacteria group bacterium]|nr:hypothetical protein [Patescibacteria group bacterium]
MVDKSKRIIILLLTVITILLVFILYNFLLKPQISGYVVNKQLEGYSMAINQIVEIVAPPRCEPLAIQYGDFQNESIQIVSIECYDLFSES